MAELVSRISPESLQNLSVLNREYRDLTGVSEQTAMRDLEMLVEQGTLKKVGKTRSRVGREGVEPSRPCGQGILSPS